MAAGGVGSRILVSYAKEYIEVVGRNDFEEVREMDGKFLREAFEM